MCSKPFPCCYEIATGCGRRHCICLTVGDVINDAAHFSLDAMNIDTAISISKGCLISSLNQGWGSFQNPTVKQFVPM